MHTITMGGKINGDSSKKYRLHRVTMGIEIESIGVEEKIKWFNRCDEAFGILCMSMPPNLLFHVESYTTPNQIWTQLESLFRKKDTLRCF